MINTQKRITSLEVFQVILYRQFSICIGNSMISRDIWHKFHEWYFKIVRHNLKFETILKYHEWYLCQISHTNHAIICLYYYPQKVVIFTCRYFKLSWNTTVLSQSNCRNFSCSSIMYRIWWVVSELNKYTCTTAQKSKALIQRNYIAKEQNVMNMVHHFNHCRKWTACSSRDSFAYN